MTRADLQTVVGWRPFIPFHIFLRDGTTFEVWQPDLIMVGRHQVLLGLATNPQQGFFDHFVVVDLSDIDHTALLAAPSTNVELPLLARSKSTTFPSRCSFGSTT